jgi:hypothetical protein
VVAGNLPGLAHWAANHLGAVSQYKDHRWAQKAWFPFDLG